MMDRIPSVFNASLHTCSTDGITDESFAARQGARENRVNQSGSVPLSSEAKQLVAANEILAGLLPK